MVRSNIKEKENLPYIKKIEMYGKIGEWVVEGKGWSWMIKEAARLWGEDAVRKGQEESDFINLKENAVNYYFSPSNLLQEVRDLVHLHTAYYEELYEFFDVAGSFKGKRETLLAKEKLLGIHRDEFTIEVWEKGDTENRENKIFLDQTLKTELEKFGIWEGNILDAEKQLQKEIFENSYHEFFKWCFKILFPNEVYSDNFHIEYLCGILQEEVERIIRKEEKGEDIIINIPPRTSKSLIASVCLNAWAWILDPTIPFICVSFDEDLSYKNSQQSKDIIKSPEYQSLFGDKFKIRSDEDSKGHWMNDKGGFRLSKTTGGNVTGHKGCIIIVDDPQNPLTSDSLVLRQKVIAYYTQSLYNRLTPANLGIRLIIMQRLHEEDLTGYLLKKNPDKYRHICLPAKLSELVSPSNLKSFYKDSLLDPLRLPPKVLSSFLETLGSGSYAGQYEQSPKPKEGNILKEKWFEIVEPKSLLRDAKLSPIHFYVDPAYTSKQENDPTGILACYFQDGFHYTLDAKEVWLEFPELIKFLGKDGYVGRFEYCSQSKIKIEPKASGLSVIQQLRKITNLNVIEGVSPKDDKITRANSISPTVEGGRCKLVKGDYIEGFLSQLTTFPNSTHDDLVDVFVASVLDFIEGDSKDWFI
jgi:predicted phage terminase large subunit-like protein